MMGYGNRDDDFRFDSSLDDDMESLMLDNPLGNGGGSASTSNSTYYNSNVSAHSSLRGSNFSTQDPLSSAFLHPPTETRPLADHEAYQGAHLGSMAGLNVPPPSYTDALLAPRVVDTLTRGGGEVSQAGGKGQGVSSLPSSSSGPPPDIFLAGDGDSELDIRVSDPEKHMELGSSSLIPGSGTYTSYLVTTKTSLAEYGGREFQTRRRFREFMTLADRLSDNFKGFIVPPRPDKQVVESKVMLGRDFVEQRRIALEKYLKRLARHPVLRTSNELIIFLTTDGKLPLLPTTDIASRMLEGAVKLPKQIFGSESSYAGLAAGGGGGEGSEKSVGGGSVKPSSSIDILRAMKELRQSAMNELGSSKKSGLGGEEDDFVAKKTKMLDLEKKIKDASLHAENLLKAQQDVNDSYAALGMSLLGIANLEEKSGPTATQTALIADTRQAATAVLKTYRCSRGASSASIRHLAQLHENMGMMSAVALAFSDRSHAQLTLQTLRGEVDSKKTKLEKLEVQASRTFGGGTANARKIEDLKREVSAGEAAVEAAAREFEMIKERNNSEVVRFDHERQRDFHSMLSSYIRTQALCAEKIEALWRPLVDQFHATS